MTQKLTKRYLFSLPQGLILLSNTFHMAGVPVFAEIVSDQAGRAAQWKRVVAVGAAGRNCHVFRNKEELMNSPFGRCEMQAISKLKEAFLAAWAKMPHNDPTSTGSDSAFTIRDVRPPGLPPISRN